VGDTEARFYVRIHGTERMFFKQLTRQLLECHLFNCYHLLMCTHLWLLPRSDIIQSDTSFQFCFQGYSDEVTGPYLELHYNYAVEKLEMGSGLAYVS
jgi:hypothetical protein